MLSSKSPSPASHSPGVQVCEQPTFLLAAQQPFLFWRTVDQCAPRSPLELAPWEPVSVGLWAPSPTPMLGPAVRRGLSCPPTIGWLCQQEPFAASWGLRMESLPGAGGDSGPPILCSPAQSVLASSTRLPCCSLRSPWERPPSPTIGTPGTAGSSDVQEEWRAGWGWALRLVRLHHVLGSVCSRRPRWHLTLSCHCLLAVTP